VTEVTSDIPTRKKKKGCRHGGGRVLEYLHTGGCLQGVSRMLAAGGAFRIGNAT